MPNCPTGRPAIYTDNMEGTQQPQTQTATCTYRLCAGSFAAPCAGSFAAFGAGSSAALEGARVEVQVTTTMLCRLSSRDLCMKTYLDSCGKRVRIPLQGMKCAFYIEVCLLAKGLRKSTPVNISKTKYTSDFYNKHCTNRTEYRILNTRRACAVVYPFSMCGTYRFIHLYAAGVYYEHNRCNRSR